MPIECREPAEGEDSRQPVHYLCDCSIDYTGPANVDTYFKPRDSSLDRETDAGGGDGEKKGPCHKTAYFRGRLLQGVDVPIPSGYTMYVCHENETGDDVVPSSQDTEGEVSTEPKYTLTRVPVKEFTMWKHHVTPDMETDSFARALDWPSLASVLHE